MAKRVLMLTVVECLLLSCGGCGLGAEPSSRTLTRGPGHR